MYIKLSMFLLLSGGLCLAQTAATGAAGAAQSGPISAAPAAETQTAPAETGMEGTQQAPDADRAVMRQKAALGIKNEESDTENANTKGKKQAQRTANQQVIRSDFELFASDAAGYNLPVYGRNLFTGAVSTFAPMDRVPVPADYVLGPGDQIELRVWGMVDFQDSLIVDRNGQIALPKVGVLNVSGLRYSQLESFLHTAIGRIYKNFELNVTMGQLRSIQIFILGQVNQPGMYTVSSLSTLVNALFASGGPSGTGTMRNIQLRRNDQVVAEFDIYDLQQKGDKSHDVKLLPGDVIYIPPVGEQVALFGNVNQPGIYELKGKNTISDLVQGAGGLTGMASTDLAILERIEDHRRRLVDQLALNSENLRRELHGGDILRIFPISPKFDNAVTLRGNVTSPGRFPWHAGMHVSDLIPSRNYLITREHWQMQNHQSEDAHPDIMTSIDANSAEINWDYAAIERLDMRDLSTRLIPFNLGQAIDNPSSVENQELQVGDVVTIFSRKDLALSMEKHVFFIRVSGEVGAPGVYRVKPGDTLREVIRQAGGLTPHSYVYGTLLTRLSAKQIQQEQLNQSILRMKRDLISRYANNPQATAQMDTQNKAVVNYQLTVEQGLIDQLADIHPTGRIILDLKKDAGNLEDFPDLALEDGDSIMIPARLGTVQIVGAVYNENAFRYEPRKTVEAYLQEAGGATRDADLSHAYVLRADGTMINHHAGTHLWSGNFVKTTLLPGDAIVVPVRIKTPSTFWQNLAPITSVLSQTATTAVIMGSYLP